jgi:hypothetical protein
VGFREQINLCLGELRDWTEKDPEAPRCPDEFYVRLRRLLRDAQRIETTRELEDRIRTVQALIASQGPVSDRFLPSLEELHARVTQSNL